jgi:hypothetical protein
LAGFEIGFLKKFGRKTTIFFEKTLAKAQNLCKGWRAIRNLD